LLRSSVSFSPKKISLKKGINMPIEAIENRVLSKMQKKYHTNCPR
jgi:hypothetical protein